MRNMLIKVKVKTGAKNEKVTKKSDDHFEICVREKPQKNSANHRVCELLADILSVPLGSVYIIKGHYRPSKILQVGKKTSY